MNKETGPDRLLDRRLLRRLEASRGAGASTTPEPAGKGFDSCDLSESPPRTGWAGADVTGAQQVIFFAPAVFPQPVGEQQQLCSAPSTHSAKAGPGASTRRSAASKLNRISRVATWGTSSEVLVFLDHTCRTPAVQVTS